MKDTDFVDLHIHSSASDGTWTPEELVAAAVKKGLGLIAVTDHDKITNVAAVRKLALANNLHFVNGVEVCSTKNGLQFHILGYGIDENNKTLQELIDNNNHLLLDVDDECIAILEKEGWPVSINEFKNYSYDRRRGGWAALAYLIDKKLCTGVNDFFQNVFTKERGLSFPVFPSVGEVISVIHKAGGIAVCAHAASGFHTKDVQQNLSILQEENLDGFECYHSGHTPTDTEFLLRYCQSHNLFITAGSDCHGNFVPGRLLGVPRVQYSQIRLPEGLIF